MNSTIREMTLKYKISVLEMMRVFYASPAVFSNGSDEIFSNDIRKTMNEQLNFIKKVDLLFCPIWK